MNQSLLPHALMVFAVALAAGSFPIGAIVAGEIPSVVLIFLRFLLAALLFAPYVFLTYGWAIPSPKRLLTYLGLSIPSVVFFCCMFESLKYTSVINTGALYTLVPGITAVYVVFINNEKLPLNRSIYLVLGMLGAIWIVVRGDLSLLMSFEFNKGDILFLIGCLFTALQNPLVKRVYQQEPMPVMTFWLLLGGSVWLGVFSVNDLMDISWQAVPLKVYPSILYLALFSTLISFFIRQKVVIEIGATRVSSYGLLAPFFVIIFSILFGLEPFELGLLPGMVVVGVAMFLIQKPQK